MVDLKKARQYGESIVLAVTSIEKLESTKELLKNPGKILGIMDSKDKVPLNNLIDPVIVKDIEDLAAGRIQESIGELEKQRYMKIT